MITKLLSSRNPLCTVILLASASISTIHAQNTYTFIGVSGASWIRSSNWSGGAASKSPGVDANTSTTVDGATNDIASFSTSSTITSVGINFNTGTNSGNSSNGAANKSLTLGAITLAAGATAGNFNTGNNSTSLDGVLTLTGPTVGSDSNVILKNSSASSLTLANAQGSGNKLMDVALGNTTDNVVILSGAGNIAISSKITGGSSNKLLLNASSSGQLVLSGANTYTGATAVTVGTLVINGDQSAATGAVSVSGTLAGSGGKIGGAVTIKSSGGHLAMGTGAAGTIGAETFSSSLAFESGSIFDWDIKTSDGTYDKVTSLSSLSVTSGAIFNVVSSTAFSDPFWTSTRSWSDIFGAGSLTNFTIPNFTYSGSSTAPTTGAFTISSNTLTWTPVPEPTSALAGLLITAGFLRRRRSA